MRRKRFEDSRNIERPGGRESKRRKGGEEERKRKKEQGERETLEAARILHSVFRFFALGGNFDAREQASKERQISSSRLRFLEELSGLRRPGVGHPTPPVGVYSSANAIAASLPIDDIWELRKTDKNHKRLRQREGN